MCNDDDFEAYDNGGDEPLIRDFNLDELAARVPADLLEPSESSPEQDHAASQHSDPPSTPIPEADTPGREREVLLNKAKYYESRYSITILTG